MKPDYKNWIPKGMLFSLIAGTMLSLALLLAFGVFGIGVGGKLRVVLGVVFGIAFVVCAKYTQWCVYAYRDLASGYAMMCRMPYTLFTVVLNAMFLLLMPWEWFSSAARQTAGRCWQIWYSTSSSRPSLPL